MIDKLRELITRGISDPTEKAKREQAVVAILIASIFVGSYIGYVSFSKKKPSKSVQNEMHFDGVFDSKFSKSSDDALLQRQQTQIDDLARKFDEQKNIPSEKTVVAGVLDSETKEQFEALKKKVEGLERENKRVGEKLQVALLQQKQAIVARPPTREEQADKFRQKAQARREYYRKAGLESVSFKKKKESHEERTPDNYVWAGTFASGIMLTGIMADAGVNGTKNMGTVLIRIDDNGSMPNGMRSKLKDCRVLASAYGDLSSESVVMRTQTLSCAGGELSFEIQINGSVFDQDAMEDVRGTPELKTKPLLEYTAAAGLLAGIGDGLANYGSAQSVTADGSLVRLSPTSIGRSAAGGALSNPANKISEYIMRIADIYHPMVVARAGRRVSVLFTTGFWIDKKHQKFESSKAVESDRKKLEEPKSQRKISSLSVSQPGSSQAQVQEAIKRGVQKQKQYIQAGSSEQVFLAEKGMEPLFRNNGAGEG